MTIMSAGKGEHLRYVEPILKQTIIVLQFSHQILKYDNASGSILKVPGKIVLARNIFQISLPYTLSYFSELKKRYTCNA